MTEQPPPSGDMSWPAFFSILALIAIAAATLLPIPSRGPNGAGIVPSDCLPSLSAAFIAGVAALAAVPALLDYKHHGRYTAPRRHIAYASLIAFPLLCYLWPPACFP